MHLRVAAIPLHAPSATADVIAPHGVLDETVNFIQKPFSLFDLANKVREVLDSKDNRIVASKLA